MRLSEASRRHLDEFGMLMPGWNIRCTAITHRCTHPTSQLMNDSDHAAFIRHATLNPLRDQLISATARLLKVAVSRAINHRTQATHATICFIRAPLVENDLTRCLFGTGKHTTHHACGCASCQIGRASWRERDEIRAGDG